MVGDIGKEAGSRKRYAFLEHAMHAFDCKVWTFPSRQPDEDWHNQSLFAVETLPTRPILIADAGVMYAAKMSGQSESYDLFTPDVGELAFLAEELGPHPFYTCELILPTNGNMLELIRPADPHQHTSRRLPVKGESD